MAAVWDVAFAVEFVSHARLRCHTQVSFKGLCVREVEFCTDSAEHGETAPRVLGSVGCDQSLAFGGQGLEDGGRASASRGGVALSFFGL